MNKDNIYVFKQSTRSNKKYMIVTPDNKKVHFGANGMSDYTLNKSIDAQRNYIKRHMKREQKYWGHKKENLLRPSYLSRHILWSKPNLNQALKNVEKHQKIKIVRK